MLWLASWMRVTGITGLFVPRTDLRGRASIARCVEAELTNTGGLADALLDVHNFGFDDLRFQAADHSEGARFVTHAARERATDDRERTGFEEAGRSKMEMTGEEQLRAGVGKLAQTAQTAAGDALDRRVVGPIERMMGDDDPERARFGALKLGGGNGGLAA